METKKITLKVDYENCCEDCWHKAREIYRTATGKELNDEGDEIHVSQELADKLWFDCEHGASEIAPCVLFPG